MDNKDNKITLFCAQSDIVLDIIERDGASFSKKEYVQKKYQEIAPVFIEVYSWFVREAINYVASPQGAEYPYWAFKDLYNVDTTNANVLELSIPIDEVIFFDMYDWNKIMCHKYIGLDKEDEEKFSKKLIEYGIKKESDVISTNFYPHLKREIQESWKRLFRHHQKIKEGNYDDVKNIQVGLWQIKKEWIIKKQP